MDCSKKTGKNKYHVVHPVSSGPVNCLITVDNVIRATTECGTPQKISLSPTVSSQWNNEKDQLLEPLQNTRHLFMREYKKPLQFSINAKKKYQIINSTGDCVFYAVEQSSCLRQICFLRDWCGYRITLLSLDGEEVLEFNGRPGYDSIALTVKDSEDEIYGYIKKRTNICTPSYSLMSEDHQEILRIKGPEGSSCCCTWADCGSEDFDIRLPDGSTSIGKISREWEYLLEDLCGVFVPVKLDDRTMSLLLASVFLLNFNFYQGRKDASCFGRCFLTLIFFTMFVLLLFLISKK